ncbi:MAG: hypothetical protein NT118_16140 [Lentisphaerae bacterium]|nr:hypothetical protein [Lentisphaerota bacterium]
MIKDEKKKPSGAFAVQPEGIKNKSEMNVQVLTEIRNLVPEQVCDFLNRRYNLDLVPGARCTSPLRDKADNPTSFVVNYVGSWHDFGAPDKDRDHGDIIDFIRIREGVDFITAVGIIAAELGLEASGIDKAQMIKIQWQRDALKLMMAELEFVTHYCEQQLAAHPEIMEVVLARGFTKEFILRRRIGFLDSINGYRQWMSQQHPDTLFKLYISNLENRIILPYFDAGSRVVYLIGRML